MLLVLLVLLCFCQADDAIQKQRVSTLHQNLIATSNKTDKYRLWIQIVENASLITNGTERNYYITQSYYELGVLLGQTLNLPTQVNWFSLATWASNTVGYSIRKETGQFLIDQLLDCPNNLISNTVCVVLKLFPAILELAVNQQFEVTSQQLAAGNVLVYKEIGISFSSFGLTFENVLDVNEAQQLLPIYLSQFNSTTQSNLISALSTMWQLRYYTNLTNSARAQKLALATITSLVEEQGNLQPYVEASFPPSLTIPIPGAPITLVNFQVLVTKTIMSLVTSDNKYFLSQDVPPISSTSNFPPLLLTLDDQQLISLYTSFVPNINSLSGTAAQNWAVFAQRLRFVSALVRTTQFHEELITCPPFTTQQVNQIWSGQQLTGPQCVAQCCPTRR